MVVSCCSGIELVHPWQVVAQACAGRGLTTLLAFEIKEEVSC